MTGANLTVVIPVFNGQRYLAETLTSVTRQRDAEVLAIVIDDGSTDDSVAIAKTHPLNPIVIEQTNAGVAVARNRGLAQACTPWVAFLDQDDIWHEDRAATLIHTAQRTGARAVGTTEQAFALDQDREALESIGDGRSKWPARWLPSPDTASLLDAAVGGSDDIEELSIEALMKAPVSVTTAFMYDRVAAISAGGCAPFIRAADDYVLNVNITNLFGPIARVKRPMLFYRVHPDSTTTVSPLVVPLLTTHLALRHGRALPSKAVSSPFLRDLQSRLPESSLNPLEQAALVYLTSPKGRRLVSIKTLARRLLRKRFA